LKLAFRSIVFLLSGSEVRLMTEATGDRKLKANSDSVIDVRFGE
jgi:hypothetical protein